MKQKRKAPRALAAIALAACLLAACSDSPDFADPAFDSGLAAVFRLSLEQSLVEFKIPGAVFAVQSPDGARWFGAAGKANPETGLPMAADLHFRVGSVTKTFIATVILQMHDQGLLSLDTPLENYLPGIIQNSDVILIRHLLGMNSGLDDYFNNPAWQAQVGADPLRVWGLAELVAFSQPNPALVPGGDYVDYSNVNYVLLGMIIEKITGKGYRQAVEEFLLDPLLLSDTSLPENNAMPSPFASGFLWEEEKVKDLTFFFDPSWAGPAGNIISRADDMLDWAQVLVEGSMLSKATAQERLAHPRAWASRPGWTYGLGMARNDEGLTGHGGDYSGMFTSMAAGYKGYFFAVLTNGQAKGGKLKEADALHVLQKAIADAKL